jgi:hypothetical protein
VPTDPVRACVDADRAEAIEVCIDKDHPPSQEFNCYRRIADGNEFWLSPGFENHPDPTAWELCDVDARPLRGQLPPRPCFTVGCPIRNYPGQDYVYSTCTERKTKELFFCGVGDRVWDENCCLRARCSTSADCGPDEECRNGILDNLMVCRLGSTETTTVDLERCSCAGALGGPPSGFCYSKQ